MWGMYGIPAGPTMRQRIIKALRGLGTVTGRTDIMRAANVTVPEWNTFTSNMRIMIGDGEIIETRVDVPGTGNAGPQVYEYTYRLVEPKR